MRCSPWIALVSTVLLAPAPSRASEPEAGAVESLVQAKLLVPLAARERPRIRFSRAALPPRARRVRIPDAAQRTDEAGAVFVRFVVDERRGFMVREGDEGWQREVITGCVYPDRGQVFVKRGDDTYPAALLLEQKAAAAAAYTCQERAVDKVATASAPVKAQ